MIPTPQSVDSPIRVDGAGVARIADTRVTLSQVVDAFLRGASAEEISLRYDVLELGDIYATLAHYLHHREQIDSHLAMERTDTEQARADHAEVVEIDELRARLLSRTSA